MKPYRLILGGHVQNGEGTRPVALQRPQQGVTIWGTDPDDAVSRFEAAFSALIAAEQDGDIPRGNQGR